MLLFRSIFVRIEYLLPGPCRWKAAIRAVESEIIRDICSSVDHFISKADSAILAVGISSVQITIAENHFTFQLLVRDIYGVIYYICVY